MAIDVAELLSRELGTDRVLRTPDTLEAYARDESGRGVFPPDAAVLCESRAEIELVLRLAAEHAVPVTPRGTGTGMTGGALPVRGGLVLSTERMKRILDISVDDRIAIVEPGVVNGDLQAAVEAQSMFYAPDPASLAMCSMGGNVAENAGGPRAFKYGVTRDWTLGLVVTLMGGETLRLGRKTPKGVTGYDLTALFVGSEGTFGVTSEITVKLVGRPEGVGTLVAIMPDAMTAGRAVSAIIRKGYRPRALEPHGSRDDRSRAPEGGVHVPRGRGRARAHRARRRARGHGGEPPALRPAVRGSGRDRRHRRARRGRPRAPVGRAPVLREGAARGARVQAVRGRRRAPGSIAEMLKRVDGIAAKENLMTATFGHAGDGNLHVNVLTDENHKDEAVAARIQSALAGVFRAALDLGGTLSGEHGIGIAKARYMAWEQSEEVIGWQKRLKRMWDPQGLLNPGKIFT